MTTSPLGWLQSRQRRIRRFIRRFVVADRSMEPTLQNGQGLIGVSTSTASVGQLRCVEHPGRPGFWLVKRVESIGNEHGERMMRVASDNRDVAAIDSRRFGAVPVAGSYRVVVRIPTRWM